jgi:hypothetical protein
MIRVVKPLIWLPVALLGGCDVAPEGPDSSTTIPVQVQSIIDASVPLDGRVYISSKNRILISPTTVVCSVPADFGVSSALLFGALGQSPSNRSGSDRQYQSDDPQCKKQGSVMILGKQLLNRKGSQYKLILAVWQYDALWVGAIERSDGIRNDQRKNQPFRDGLPPPAFIKRSQDKRFQISESIKLDGYDLSTNFINSLTRSGK